MYIKRSCNFHEVPTSQARIIKKFYDLLGHPSYMLFLSFSADGDPREEGLPSKHGFQYKNVHCFVSFFIFVLEPFYHSQYILYNALNVSML